MTLLKRTSKAWVVLTWRRRQAARLDGSCAAERHALGSAATECIRGGQHSWQNEAF